MVRFEKLLYESVLNTKALGRQRVLGSPQKWFKRNIWDDLMVAHHNYLQKGVSGAIFRLFEPILAYFVWTWPRDIALQRGLAMEDFYLHNDREQRREYMFEKINRESMHPYQHLFFKRRRARYYKVERALKGFFVPSYIRKEAEERLLSDTALLMRDWHSHQYLNYYSDMTPATRYTAMHRLIPLEIFNVYGLFQTDSWDRYFMNEIDYDDYTAEDDAKARVNPFGDFNLDTEEGRKNFESEVNRFIKLYPATIVQEGQAFNFKEFYAKYAISQGKDTSRWDSKFIDEVKGKMWYNSKEFSSMNVDGKHKIITRWEAEDHPESTKKYGSGEKVVIEEPKSTLGTEFPARLKSKNRKVLM